MADELGLNFGSSAASVGISRNDTPKTSVDHDVDANGLGVAHDAALAGDPGTYASEHTPHAEGSVDDAMMPTASAPHPLHGAHIHRDLDVGASSSHSDDAVAAPGAQHRATRGQPSIAPAVLICGGCGGGSGKFNGSSGLAGSLAGSGGLSGATTEEETTTAATADRLNNRDSSSSSSSCGDGDGGGGNAGIPSSS
jgi:hypothetical protein